VFNECPVGTDRMEPNRIAKLIYYILILTLTLVSCQKKSQKHEGPLRLSEAQMTDLIREVQIAESAVFNRQNLGGHPDTLKKNYFDLIFRDYGISPEIFKENMTYYTQHPELLERIYDTVISQLKSMQDTLDLETKIAK